MTRPDSTLAPQLCECLELVRLWPGSTSRELATKPGPGLLARCSYAERRTILGRRLPELRDRPDLRVVRNLFREEPLRMGSDLRRVVTPLRWVLVPRRYEQIRHRLADLTVDPPESR
jgi:hypothetical protein